MLPDKSALAYIQAYLFMIHRVAAENTVGAAVDYDKEHRRQMELEEMLSEEETLKKLITYDGDLFTRLVYPKHKDSIDQKRSNLQGKKKPERFRKGDGKGTGQQADAQARGGGFKIDGRTYSQGQLSGLGEFVLSGGSKIFRFHDAKKRAEHPGLSSFGRSAAGAVAAGVQSRFSGGGSFGNPNPVQPKRVLFDDDEEGRLMKQLADVQAKKKIKLEVPR